MWVSWVKTQRSDASAMSTKNRKDGARFWRIDDDVSGHATKHDKRCKRLWVERPAYASYSYSLQYIPSACIIGGRTNQTSVGPVTISAWCKSCKGLRGLVRTNRITPCRLFLPQTAATPIHFFTTPCHIPTTLGLDQSMLRHSEKLW